MSSTFSRRFRQYRLLLGVCGLGAAGCASEPPRPALEDVAELMEVPFFPQSEFDCGPAALATILNWASVAVTPEELIDAVYIAGLKGSLQAELLAATRRHGLIPYVLPPGPDALFAELEDERPVLVLQNLGIERVPVWHYAVAVGFDPADERVILRSGTEPRRLEKTSRFLRSWQRGGYWAFVPVEPGELPASATPALYVRALAGAEPLLTHDAADEASLRERYRTLEERLRASHPKESETIRNVLTVAGTRAFLRWNTERARRLDLWMRVWRWVHVPVSVALFFLVTVHVWMVLAY